MTILLHHSKISCGICWVMMAGYGFNSAILVFQDTSFRFIDYFSSINRLSKDKEGCADRLTKIYIVRDHQTTKQPISFPPIFSTNFSQF